MIRLVTQFDDAETRASAATPTCGGCSSSCCCCCCVATAISTSAFTAMNLRAHVRELDDEARRGPSPWAEILGALALALALLFGIGLWRLGIGGWVALAVPAAWFLILLGLYAWVRAADHVTPALATVVLSCLAALLEVVLGAGLVVSGRSGVVAYLVLAVVVALGVSMAMYRRLLVRP